MRYAWELIAHCWRVLQRHRAEGMAAELTYRTIFSLIPILVLGLVTFKILGGLDEVQKQVEQQLFTFFGVPEVSYSENILLEEDLSSGKRESSIDEEAIDPGEDAEPDDVTDAASDEERKDSEKVEVEVEVPSKIDDESVEEEESPATDANERLQVQASIRKALSQLTAQVAQLDFASIGFFGLLLFIYAAIALTDSVEHIFNLIYAAPEGRPIHLRIAIQWSIITLGSGLLALSLYMSGEVVEILSAATFGDAIKSYFNHAVAILASWVLLFLLYALMPNTRVSARSAAIGAFVAAILWEIAKAIFRLYVTTALPYSALYGSLGLIPMFIFWIYITWLIILFGLVWTYTLQTAAGRIPGREEDEATGEIHSDVRWYVPLMAEVANGFSSGRIVDAQELSQRLRLPVAAIVKMTSFLIEHEMLRRVESEDDSGFLLARPADRISIGQILRLGSPRPPGASGPGWQLLEQLQKQASDDLDKTYLSDLLSDPPPEQSSSSSE